MTTNGFRSDDFDLAPSTMKYKDLHEDGDPYSVSTSTPAPSHSPAESRWGCTTREKILFVLVGVLIIITFGFGIATVANLRQQSGSNYPTSCKDALAKGRKVSGLMKIQPTNVAEPYQVYCDMSSAGGGWTMVSSIHDESGSDSCATGDLWSSESRYSSSGSKGYLNWKNLLTFGEPTSATSADYKSQAFYNVPASNLMIWHVPNDVPLSEISNMAFFKYYTKTNFLSKYGKTLKSLYTSYVPLKRLLPYGLLTRLMPCFQSNWTLYNVTSRRTSPSSTPKSSERISVSVNNGNYTKISPGVSNNISSEINITSSVTDTSTTILAWVSNTDRLLKSIYLKIDGYKSSRGRSYLTYTSGDNLYFRYNYVCDGKKCKVLFFAGSSSMWDTKTPRIRFAKIVDSTWGLNFTNSMQRFVFGYTVFKQSETTPPSTSVMRNMVKKLLKCLGKVEFHDLNMNPPISIPAVFVKGSMADYTKNVTPGFIEFRRYDSYGYPYALCPGIKVKNTADPSLHCLGSVQTHYSVSDKCGDFSAWNKLAAHNKKKVSGGIEYSDVTSSILLFTR